MEHVAANGGRRPTVQEIADVLRERIRVGDYKAGDRMPTQTELADEFSVERSLVRQVLRALHAEGLLTDASTGSPPRVAGHQAPRSEPEPTMVLLAHRLAEAFTAPQVRVDAVCVTLLTLTLALGEPLRLIYGGRIGPRSIDFRILLPTLDINLASPVPDDEGDHQSQVHQRWLAMRNAQGQILHHNLLALRSTHGIDVHVAFRTLSFTPQVELYLLDGEQALTGYCMPMPREEKSAHEALEMYDDLGSRSLLFSFETRSGSRDAAFVEQSQKWFDALWGTTTTDLALSW
ncbi:winged helix-turn-helix domain-containing protein [Streptomyces griseorubiginosus]|uniref:winged helix-turn-helix domain-containing protein n=1 Tax=Streptomyces griseorubiginosus TaxID=67304 RepID=UPI00331EAE5A